MMKVTKCFVASVFKTMFFKESVSAMRIGEKRMMEDDIGTEVNDVIATLPENFTFVSDSECTASRITYCNGNWERQSDILGCGVMDDNAWRLQRLSINANVVDLNNAPSVKTGMFSCMELAAMIQDACYIFTTKSGASRSFSMIWRNQEEFVTSVEKKFESNTSLSLNSLKVQARISYEEQRNSFRGTSGSSEYAGSLYQYFTPVGDLVFRVDNPKCAVKVGEKLENEVFHGDQSMSGLADLLLDHENMYDLAENEHFQAFVQDGNLLPVSWTHDIVETSSCNMAYETASSEERSEVSRALDASLKYSAVSTSTSLKQSVNEEFGSNSSQHQVSCEVKRHGCGDANYTDPKGDGCDPETAREKCEDPTDPVECPCKPEAHEDCAVAISGENPNFTLLREPTDFAVFVDLKTIIEAYMKKKCDSTDAPLSLDWYVICNRLGIRTNGASPEFEEKIKMFDWALVYKTTPCEAITDCETCLRSKCAFKRDTNNNPFCMTLDTDREIWHSNLSLKRGSPYAPIWSPAYYPGFDQHESWWQNGLDSEAQGNYTWTKKRLYPGNPDHEKVQTVCANSSFIKTNLQSHSEFTQNPLECPAGYAMTSMCGSGTKKSCRSSGTHTGGGAVVAWIECNDMIPLTAWTDPITKENPEGVPYVAADPRLARDYNHYQRATCADGYVLTSFCSSGSSAQCRFNSEQKTIHTAGLCTPYPGLLEGATTYNNFARQKQWRTNIYAYNTYNGSHEYGMSDGGCTNPAYLSLSDYAPQFGVMKGICVTRKEGDVCKGFNGQYHPTNQKKLSSGLCTVWGTHPGN